jgi:hypothetical protein
MTDLYDNTQSDNDIEKTLNECFDNYLDNFSN